VQGAVPKNAPLYHSYVYLSVVRRNIGAPNGIRTKPVQALVCLSASYAFP